jgi:hypothetical protein
MSLPDHIRSRLTVPAVCVPMFVVTGPELVRQEAAENRVGALGGQLVLADLAGNMRRHPGGRSPHRRRAR